MCAGLDGNNRMSGNVAVTEAKQKGSDGQRKSLVTQAYEQIREKIILLQFLPGQYLNVASICDTLGLGRTPVNQALQLLQVEGLVEVLPRKGIIVQPDGAKEILKILDSRCIIEPELARRASVRSIEGEIEEHELAALVALAEAPDEMLDPPDVDAFIANDRAFHRMITNLSGNPILSEFVSTLHDRSCRFWYLNLWQTLNVELSKAHHIQIARAIVDGNGEEAAEFMQKHILDLAQRLERLPPNAFGLGPTGKTVS